MVESAIRAERTQEGLLKGILGSIRAEPAPQEPEHFGFDAPRRTARR